MATTYTKLRDGSWGVRSNTVRLAAGLRVDVWTKGGQLKSETVDRVVWTGGGVSIASVVSSRRTGTGRRERSCATGGNCSSFGAGRSCGAHDCDGY